MYPYKTIVFVGPSAVGKTHAANLILRTYPHYFDQAIAHTTRKPRTTAETDRVFISEEEFKRIQHKNEFIVSGRFGDNLYGYTHESITPKDKHIILNAWPALIPTVAKLDNVILVGLQASPQSLKLLRNRMANRGDSDKTINSRMELVFKDSQDMEQLNEVINLQGKVFIVDGDNTLTRDVLPWLYSKLNLQV